MGKVKGSALSRKEMRKAHKMAAKQKKQQRHAIRSAQKVGAEASSGGERSLIRRGTKGGKSEERASGEQERVSGANNGAPGEKARASSAKDRASKDKGSRSAKPGKRKRWKPEEIDPMIAAEDAEMKRLERLLGVSGPNAEKKRTKLNRELEEEDGLGPEFGAFLSDLDRLTEEVERRALGSSDDGREHEADWDFHGDITEESSASDAGGRRVEDRRVGNGRRLADRSREMLEEEEAEEEEQGEGEGEGGDEGSEGDEGEGGEVEVGRGVRAAAGIMGTLGTIDEEPDSQGSDEGGEEQGEDGEDEDGIEDEDDAEEEEEEEEEEKVDEDGGGEDDDLGDSGDEGDEGDGDGGDDADEDNEDVAGDDRGEGGGDCDGDGDEQGGDGGVAEDEDDEGGESDDSFEEPGDEGRGESGRGHDEKGAGDRDTRFTKQGADGAEGESHDFLRHVYRPTRGQDIYGRAIGSVKDGAVPTKYIPPHMRASTAGSEQAACSKLPEIQRVVNGIMNRLSEDTLEPVTARLRETYGKYSTSEVNEALWRVTKGVCVHEKQVMATLIPSFSAVIAALNIWLGADVGGYFLEVIATELHSELELAKGVGGGVGGSSRRGRGTASNLLLLLAHLYNFGVTYCTLIYDIIRLLVEAFGETEMELLLLLLQHSGYQLRSDDPKALKQIVALVKEKAMDTMEENSPIGGSVDHSPAPEDVSGTVAGDTGRWKSLFMAKDSTERPQEAGGGGVGGGSDSCGAGGEGLNGAVRGGSRARYVLDTILELQSNKRSRLQQQTQESGRRVRKWLGFVKSSKDGSRGGSGGSGGGGGGGDTFLRVSWSELLSTESRGRWWKVGAAWAGRSSGASAGRSGVRGNGREESAEDEGSKGETEETEEAVGIMELAVRQRMNTEVRRSVFAAIVGSSDCEDALEKIIRLNLKGVQEREIARVIVECCCQEETYNPFYAHLAERVCDRLQKLRFTFQIAFWDALKTLEEGASRRAASLARLMAHLVLQKQLSLTLLKTVDIPELSPSGLLLIRVFFHDIISAGDDSSFMEIFRRLARPKGAKDMGHSAARDNVLVFLRGHLGPAPRGWERERQKAFRRRVKGACRLMDAMVTAEELG